MDTNAAENRIQDLVDTLQNEGASLETLSEALGLVLSNIDMQIEEANGAHDDD